MKEGPLSSTLFFFMLAPASPRRYYYLFFFWGGVVGPIITHMNHQKAFYCLNSQFLLTYQCIDRKQ